MPQKIRFSADGLELSGTLHLPDIPAPPVVVGVHGLLSTGDSPKQQALAERLNRCGIAYFRFDHRGCGNSSGRFSDVTSFKGRCSDLAAAIRFVRSDPRIGRPLGLFGSSMGGAICLAVAPDFDCRTVVTLAAPVRLASISVPLNVKTDPAFNGMKPDQMAFNISDRLSGNSDILIIHGDADQIVPYPNSEEIFKNAGHPKTLFRLEGADHVLSQPRHQEQFMEQATAWFSTRLAGDRRQQPA